MLECDVPSNGTRRRSCGGKLLREMQERDGHIENVAKVFDEMLTAREVKLSLRSASGSVLPVTGSTQFSKRMREQDNRPSSTHGISSSSSSSYRRQSFSPREFTFRVFSFITKAIPRFALIL
jgi:hypothetical protein